MSPSSLPADPAPPLAVRFWRPLAWMWLSARGWKIVGEMPKAAKFVIVAAPHTTNWDLPYTLSAGLHYGLRVNWMGKSSLFKPPFGGFMRWLGGISVDRNKSTNAVAQMAEVFRTRDRLVLVVAPEGTRSAVTKWKSGFYHIAHAARVPLALCFIDYDRKVAGVAEVFYPSGDYEADLPKILAIYSTATGGKVRAIEQAKLVEAAGS